MKNRIKRIPSALLAAAAVAILAAATFATVAAFGPARALGVAFGAVMTLMVYLIAYTLIELYREGDRHAD